MEADLEDAPLDLGRLRVAIAFADLAGYTRLTEEEGEEEAVDAVERFIEDVEVTLPDDARVIKTIGDEVMIVGSDAGGARRLGRRLPAPGGRPRARCRGSACTTARRSTATATTTAARSTWPRAWPRAPPAARSSSRARSSSAPGAHLEFERIGEVRLKGFDHATELFVALPRRRRWLTTCSTASRATGLLGAGADVVVLLSGGRDSVCLLDVAVALRLLGARAARQLRPARGGRRRRGALPRAVRAPRGGARRAPRRRGPTSPGQPAGVGARRALRGGDRGGGRRSRGRRPHRLRPGRDRALPAGRLARAPRAAGDAAALGPARAPAARRVTREETGAWCRARGLAWRDDATNASDDFARGRVRHGLLAALEAVDARAAANVVRTAELLREEAEVLDVVVDTALAGRDRIARGVSGRPAAGARAAHRAPARRGRHRGPVRPRARAPGRHPRARRERRPGRRRRGAGGRRRRGCCGSS